MMASAAKATLPEAGSVVGKTVLVPMEVEHAVKTHYLRIGLFTGLWLVQYG